MKLLLSLVAIISLVALSVGWWKIFTKSGRDGWEALIPTYNFYICIKEIVHRPIWWIVLCVIPIINIPFLVIICVDVAKRFGKKIGFGLGLFFFAPVFALLLGFGDDEYQGDPPVELEQTNV